MPKETKSTGEDTRHTYDIVVIGLGPAGLQAMSYGGFRGLSMLGIDELDCPGGKIPLLYGWKLIKDVFPPLVGNDFIEQLVENARQYNTDFKLRERTLKLWPNSGTKTFTVVTERDSYVARAVIIAAGTGSIRLNYFPQKEFLFYLGNGFSYYQVRPKECAGKEVLVIGGGASATEMVPYIARYASHVTIAHRRTEFRADSAPFLEELYRLAKLTPPKVTILTPYELEQIHGQYRVNGATLRNSATGESRRLNVQVIVACLGYAEDLGPIKDWGFGKDGMHGKLLKVNERYETTIPGVFAIGECAVPPWHKTRIPLIQTWLSEAVHAVCFAYQYITGKKAFQEYSTIMDRR